MQNRRQRRQQARKMRTVDVADHSRVIAELEDRSLAYQQAIVDLTNQCQQLLTVTALLLEKGIVTNEEIKAKEKAILDKLTNHNKEDPV